MKCPKCGKQMHIASQDKNLTLWKCEHCGHITLVQEFDRNDVGRRIAGGQKR